MATDTTTLDWLELRRLRAAPPATVPPADHGVFRASLEQADSYFGAAGVAGPSTNAVLIYYGYVQLAKAIQLAGGIKATSHHGLYGSRTSGSALSVRVGSANQCGHLLGVQLAVGDDPAPLPKCSIRDLFLGHPDLHDLFPDETEGRPVLLVKRRGDTVTVGQRLAKQPMTTSVKVAGPQRGRDELQAIVNALPLPKHYEFGARVVPFDKQRPSRYGWGIDLDWIDTQDDEGVWTIWDLVDIARWTPRGPAFAADPLTIAPLSPAGTEWSRLSWWWPILFGFGHITRYAPEQWARAVNLDTSKSAADIHELLRRARAMMPSLGLWAINEAERHATLR